MTLDDILLEAEERMEKTEQVVVNEFAGVRTGKASASLVENIMVDVYGSNMRIRELAGIMTPEPRTLPSSRGMRARSFTLRKAIQKANLGLNPATQGKTIRIFFPELSQERRVEFTKILKKMAEEGRVASGMCGGTRWINSRNTGTTAAYRGSGKAGGEGFAEVDR